MKRIALLVLTLALSASTAGAQTGINLAVGDCSAGSSNHTVINACTSNAGTLTRLAGSVVMPAVTLTGFVGAQSFIDIMTVSATLPDWWRADACRSNEFQVTADQTIGITCPTPWDNLPAPTSTLVATYPAGGANRIRLVVSTALAPSDAYDLTGDGVTELTVFNLSIQRAHTTGDGTCAGCSTGACLTLQEIDLQRLTDTPESVLRMTMPFYGNDDNSIRYNAGTICLPTPVRNHTWGSIKSLYR